MLIQQYIRFSFIPFNLPIVSLSTNPVAWNNKINYYMAVSLLFAVLNISWMNYHEAVLGAYKEMVKYVRYF